MANVVGDDGDAGRRARTEMRAAAGEMAAPDLIDVETVSVLRGLWLKGTISHERFGDAVSDLEDLNFDRYPALPFMRRAWELRSTITAYDAAYVALAEVLAGELLTCDERLANSTGPRCAIRVLR